MTNLPQGRGGGSRGARVHPQMALGAGPRPSPPVTNPRVAAPVASRPPAPAPVTTPPRPPATAPVTAPPRPPAPQIVPGGEAVGAGAGGNLRNLPVAVKRLFFTNVSEVREQMMTYVTSTQQVTVIPVPGNGRVAYQECSPRARWTSESLMNWFTDLHDLGYCLEGAFDESSFGINQLVFLQGDMLLESLVKEISATVDQNGVDGVHRNMSVVANIIQYHINCPTQIPEDLSHLLDVLREYNITYAPLVRKHVSNEHEDVKTAVFLKMHQRLK